MTALRDEADFDLGRANNCFGENWTRLVSVALAQVNLTDCKLPHHSTVFVFKDVTVIHVGCILGRLEVEPWCASYFGVMDVQSNR